MANPGEGEGAVIFDFSYFDTYTSGDESLQREVMQLFFRQIDGLVADLDPVGSIEAWRAGAHAIKGGARGLGLARVGDLCQEMERVKEEDATNRRPILVQLEEAVRAARQSVADQYGGIFDT